MPLLPKIGFTETIVESAARSRFFTCASSFSLTVIYGRKGFVTLPQKNNQLLSKKNTLFLAWAWS
jgi:hypothetical protein